MQHLLCFKLINGAITWFYIIMHSVICIQKEAIGIVLHLQECAFAQHCICDYKVLRKCLHSTCLKISCLPRRLSFFVFTLGLGGTRAAIEFLPYPYNSHNKNNGRTPHGLALIFENENFYNSNGPRLDKHIPSAPRDTELLRNSLRQLGYRVVVRKDQTAEAMLDAFDKIRTNSDGDLHIEKDDDSFICVIGTHGGFTTTDVICGSNLDKTFDLRATVYDKLGAVNCACLREKPKLFFVQACRGDGIEALAANIPMSGSPNIPQAYRLPEGSDFFFSYPTGLKKLSYFPKPPNIGPCFYFEALCGGLDKHAPKLGLMNIILFVHQQLDRKAKYLLEYEGQTTRLCPHVSTSLRGPVFFFDSAKERFARSLD